jgi:hypothetical protein
MGQMRNMHRVLLGKPEENRQLGRPVHRCEDNIKMDLKQDGTEWPGFIWIRIGASGRLV